jgi:hypothetical protein
MKMIMIMIMIIIIIIVGLIILLTIKCLVMEHVTARGETSDCTGLLDARLSVSLF